MLAAVREFMWQFSPMRTAVTDVQVLLELYRIGLTRLRSLSLISPPPDEALNAAQSMLQLLDAVQSPDKKERVYLTDMGTRLAAFPVDPPLARYISHLSLPFCCAVFFSI